MQYNKETKTLIISCDFNEELKDIPNDTQIIIFENKDSIFNQKVDNLPLKLTHLTFGAWFNQKVDNLPKNIIHLTFGYYFNKEVDNLPKNLTHITFSNDCVFNQKVDYLPKNLTHLFFSDDFNQKVDNLPKNLTHLFLSDDFNQKVDNLPKNLKYLKIKWYYNNEIILPKSLKKLSLSCNNNLINNIPEHIEKIYIYFYYKYNYNKRVENLPSTIKEIIIEDEEYKKYIKIPFGCILTIKNIE
jgi:hypothetical protein